MKDMNYDVMIIGGGPAGSSAARRLANKGLSVVVLEKAPMPRFKLCGGALSEHAMAYLDFDLPVDLFDWECYGARVSYNKNRVTSRKNDRIAVLVTRKEFDSFLLDKASSAGAVVKYEEALFVHSETGRYITRTKDNCYSTRFVIIAAGVTNRFIRLVRKPDKRSEYGVCLEAEIPVETCDRFRDLAGLIDIYFGVAKYGYGWVFHHGSYYSIGVGGLVRDFASPHLVMRDFLEMLGFESAKIKIRSSLIPRGGLKRSIVKDGVLLVGDSAGFVDPFYGEGIAYAIRSGQLAADVIAESCIIYNNNNSSLYKYQIACNNEFNRNLRYSLLLSRLMHAFPSFFLKLMAKDSALLDKYLDVPMMRLTYKDFLLWSCLHVLRSFLNQLR